MADHYVSMDQEEVQQSLVAFKEVPGIQAVYEHISTVMAGLRVVWVRTDKDLYLVQTPRQLVLLKVKLHWDQWQQHMYLR